MGEQAGSEAASTANNIGMGVHSATHPMGLPVAVLLLAMVSSASAFSAGSVSLLPRGSHSCSIATPVTLAPSAAIKSRTSPLIVMAAAAAKKVPLSRALTLLRVRCCFPWRLLVLASEAWLSALAPVGRPSCGGANCPLKGGTSPILGWDLLPPGRYAWGRGAMGLGGPIKLMWGRVGCYGGEFDLAFS